MVLTEVEVSNKLYLANTFRDGSREVRLVFLLPEFLWRPVKATLWRGKEVSIIAGDERRHAPDSIIERHDRIGRRHRTRRSS
jgi:hypothetical protein